MNLVLRILSIISQWRTSFSIIGVIGIFGTIVGILSGAVSVLKDGPEVICRFQFLSSMCGVPESPSRNKDTKSDGEMKPIEDPKDKPPQSKDADKVPREEKEKGPLTTVDEKKTGSRQTLELPAAQPKDNAEEFYFGHKSDQPPSVAEKKEERKSKRFSEVIPDIKILTKTSESMEDVNVETYLSTIDIVEGSWFDEGGAPVDFIRRDNKVDIRINMKRCTLDAPLSAIDPLLSYTKLVFSPVRKSQNCGPIAEIRRVEVQNIVGTGARVVVHANNTMFFWIRK